MVKSSQWKTSTKLIEDSTICHNGIIPSNEIWVKFSGDKGDSSFKTSLEVGNAHKPNSVINSFVLANHPIHQSIFILHWIDRMMRYWIFN